jgi:hypothetical protein
MRSVAKQFGLVFLSALPIAFLFQWYLERSGNSDALGLWYTIFCAVAYSSVMGAIVTALATLVRRSRS